MSAEEWSAAWSEALDDLELTLEQTEELLAGRSAEPGSASANLDPWSPPEMASPLPPHLLERAQTLLARQHQAIEATSSAMRGARANIAFVDRVVDASPVRRRAASVYLDVRA